MIVRQEGGLVNMTPTEMKSAMDRAKNLSKNFTVIEALASFASPASLSGEVLYGDAGKVPDHWIYAQQVSDIYQRYLESTEFNYDEAEAAFIADMGLDMLLLTGPSGFDTDAAPPTRGAMALRQTYREGYEKYGPILASILTSKDGSEFDLGLYSIQMGYGERIQLPVEMRIDLANQRILDYIYHDKAMRIANADVSDMEQQWAMNSVKDQLQALGWKGQDTGRSMQERGIAADLMLEAARDPEMTPFMGKATQRHLVEYLMARKAAIESLRAKGLAGDLAGTGVSGAEELNYLFTLGETMAANDVNFFVIWNKALRSEVLYEEDEEG